MQYTAHAVNAEEGPPTRLLDNSLLCMNLLRVRRRALCLLRAGNSSEHHHLVKQLLMLVKQLRQHPPQQHTATGRPACWLFQVLNTVSLGDRSAVVSVQHMRHTPHTDTIYEPVRSNEQHVLKIFTVKSPELVQYAAQELVAFRMGLDGYALQASDVGIVWLKYEQHTPAQPALAMLMPRFLGGTLDYLFDRWQAPTVLKPSAGYVLRMAFDLMLGLIAMHQRGVVHRDMKPTNIGVMQGRLVALDLGLAQDSTRDDTELVAHPAVTGAYMYMAPELDLAGLQAVMQQPLIRWSAEMRHVSSEGNVGAVHCCQELQELRLATQLQISRPDYAHKASIFSSGMLLLQMVTYGKPPFWMLNVINPKSPQELQEEVIDDWIKLGPRKLLEATYWHPLHDYPIIRELDSLLLDFLSEALAPPWRRQDAQKLAGHPLFEQLGAFLVQELETGPLEDDRLYLEHLLCSWSTYHPEAAKRLCINLVAADVLFNSIDPDVQVFANWNLLSQQEEALSLDPLRGTSEAVPGGSVLRETVIVNRADDMAHDEQATKAAAANKVNLPVGSEAHIENLSGPTSQVMPEPIEQSNESRTTA